MYGGILFYPTRFYIRCLLYDYRQNIHAPNIKYYQKFILNISNTIDNFGSLKNTFVMDEAHIFHLFLQGINPLDDVHDLHAFQYVGRDTFRTCTGKNTDHITDHEIMILGGTFIRTVGASSGIS